MNQQNHPLQRRDVEPSTTSAVATLAPAYVMVADSEAGYTDIAQKLHNNGMLPKGYYTKDGRPEIGKAALAMIAGREHGLSPLAAINGFAVINGAARPWGTTQRGICDRFVVGELTGCIRGLAEMKYMATEALADDEAVAKLEKALQRALLRRLARYGWTLQDGKWSHDKVGAMAELPGNYGCGYAVYARAGRPLRVELFDSADAHAAKLLTRTSLWTDWLARMLEAKAVTFALRAAFSGALSGIAEVADDMAPDDTPTITPAAPASAAMDGLLQAARPTAPAAPLVQDAEFMERPEAARDNTGAPEPTGPDVTPPAPTTRYVGTAEGLASMNGSDALRVVLDRVKSTGADPDAFKAQAMQRADLPADLPVKRMSHDQRGALALALAEIHNESENEKMATAKEVFAQAHNIDSPAAPTEPPPPELDF